MTTPRQRRVTNGLIAHWGMRENVVTGGTLRDLVGGHDATVVGGGVGSNGLSCGNASQNYYAEIPDSADLSFGDATTDCPFTVSAWVYTTSVFALAQAVVTKRGTFLEWNLQLLAGGDVSMTLFNNASNQRIGLSSTSTPVAGNAWTCIGASYDGSGARTGISLYVNGGLISATTSNDAGSYTAMHDTTEPVRLGIIGTSTIPFSGWIANARIYDRVLSAAEHKMLCTAGRQ